MPLPTMPTQPAQLLDPAEFKPFGKAARPKAGQEPRKPVPALEREALSETGRAQPKRSATRARLGEASPMAKEDARQRPTVVAKAVDKVSTTGKSTETAPRRRARRDDGPTKLFVLDTNVLMHDPSSLFRFEEHDVYLPMMTLEELDNHKKGMSEVARNARAVSRTLDQLVAGTDGVMEDGLPLSKLGNRDAQGHLFFQTRLNDIKLPDGLPQGKADNQILGVVSALQQQRPDRHVVLVSKDINMRIKARALGLPAEDYFNDRVLEDTDLLYSGVMSLPIDFWQKHGKNIESWQDPKTGTTFYRLSGPLVPSFLVNQFVFLEPNDGSLPLYAQVKELNGKTAVLQTLKDYTHQKNNVWGVTARNREQNFALNLLMHPEIDFVSLLGQAGTGKTLLALAAGLEQVLDQKLYNEIIITRATVPVGEDIGFLPGTEEEKMQPWMGAFDDNLEVLQKSDDNAGEWGRAATQELIRSRIKVKSMNFMRGRTFVNKFLIIDEAQNLTPKQMKTLVTRAGPGTKIVCLGNIAQIDTPYLTEGSSGLTYVVDRFKGWSHGGHITLARGERSRLADHASDVL
ncbi:PhoH family protein [Ralstonia solanacearum]|uniref:PhoH family protein n=1 Tax=Ralstonia solanacearum TaxID=305 RepID=UPI000580545E|nr:PhoH family protein [Ralstonia solanacearum]MCL9846501.1 PhoH family protein [Ralstonia solanacearum]MCL9850800.1 PhoH family protein [Ralstonia solanacearum]MCL9854155.1 PhoH family protein [Ralstonia solanacearum]MCL9859286.1 PhoH family protein [Ralstonia solanacearum]MCL9864041.1 PhoH family protein [Ralstonia solanacearum]